MSRNRRRVSNAIEVDFVARMLSLCLLVMIAALFFVYLKNQQHAVGDQARVTEMEIREFGARSQAFASRITSLTSRAYLQRKLDEGYIRLEAIRDTAVARVTPPAETEPDGVLRTASSEPSSGVAAGVPQRVMRR